MEDTILEKPTENTEAVPDPFEATSKQIRGFAAHKVISPTIADAMGCIADLLELKERKEPNYYTKVARSIVVYESDNLLCRDRLAALEKRNVELSGQLKSLMSDSDNARLRDELNLQREVNKQLSEALSNQFNSLLEDRVDNLAADNADLRKQIRGLEEVIAGLRKNIQENKPKVSTLNPTSEKSEADYPISSLTRVKKKIYVDDFPSS